MRAVVDTEGCVDVVAAARSAIAMGAEEVVVVCDCAALEVRAIASLRALGRVRLRLQIATFDEAAHARLALRGRPRELLRSLVRASAGGLSVDVVLPIAEGLGPVAGRLHGLVRATGASPHARRVRYLLSPVPDGLTCLAPAAIALELELARAAADELGAQLHPDDDTRIDTELQAVLAGIKPVMRLSTEGTDEQTLRARYAGFGLVACAADGTFIDEEGEHGRRLRLVYVAKSIEVAERVRDVEAKTFAPRTSVESRAREYRDLGVALGYPACCVDAYVERAIVAPSAGPGNQLAEAFLVATGALHPSPSWLLNHLLFETGAALITFTPCSYRCDAALDYASRVLAHVERVAPLAALRLRRRLAVDVVVDRHGARAIVERDGDRIASAHPRRAPGGAFVHALDHDLVRRLLDGTRESPPPVVVPFSVSC